MTTSCDCDRCGNELCPGDVLCPSCGVECDPDKALGYATRRPMDRGCTVSIDYSLVDENNTAINTGASGLKLWFTVKDYLSRADSEAIWQGTLVSGIAATGAPAAGNIRVTIPASVTQYVDDGLIKLYYDLKLLDGSGRATIIEKGLFEVSPAATRSIA